MEEIDTLGRKKKIIADLEALSNQLLRKELYPLYSTPESNWNSLMAFGQTLCLYSGKTFEDRKVFLKMQHSVDSILNSL